MSELAKLVQAFVRLGSDPTQAEIMAAQLLKRAEQLSLERGTPREVELAKLLELVIRARSGEPFPEFRPSASPSDRNQ